MAVPTAELARLAEYNAGIYNAGTNPYGMDSYGYVTNLPLLASDAATVANWLNTDVLPLATAIDDITALAALTTQITALGGITAAISTLAGLSTQLTALGAITTAISTVATNAAAVSAVNSALTAINAVNSALTAVNAVYAALTAINTVNGALTNINTVAARATDIALLADIEDGTLASQAIQTVATNSTAVVNVSDHIADIETVADDIANVNTVAGISTDVQAVAADAADIGIVSTNIASVNTAAANIAAIIAAPTAASDAQAYADAARRVATFYTYDTAIIDADPGNGQFTFNNATISSATVIYVDLLDAVGNDMTDWIATWDDSTTTTNRGEITFTQVNDPTVWAKFIISGANTTATGYRKIAVTYVDGDGSFTDGVEYAVGFARTGDKGTDGLGAGDVIGPASVTDGRFALFDGTTGKLLKEHTAGPTSFATAAQGALADTSLQPDDMDPVWNASILPTLDLIFNSSSAIQSSWFTRASTATSFDALGVMRTAAVNELRIDHDPVTGMCKGALIEEARTNLLTYSDQLDNAAWTKTFVTVTANADVAPDGVTTMDKIVESGALNGHYTQQNVTAVSGVVHAASVFVKAGERTLCDILAFGGASYIGVNINLSTGVISAPQHGGVSNGASVALVQNCGGGVWRVTLPVTTTSTQVGLRVALSNGAITYTGDGTSGLYAWGAQIEAASFPSSYIPTTTAAATRAADLPAVSGSAFTSVWNAREGTFLVKGRTPLNAATSHVLWQVDDGTSDNRILVYRSNVGQIVMQCVVGGVSVVSSILGTVAIDTDFSVAVAWAVNDFAGSLNGAAVVTDTSATVPAVTALRIGHLNGSLQWGGPEARITYLPRRQSNAALQAMTI